MNKGKAQRKHLPKTEGGLSRGQNKLIGKFNMAAGDVISIKGQVIEYTYIPTGIKRELVRFGVDCDWKR